MKEFKVNILGSEYTVEIADHSKYPHFEDVYGWCDFYSKVITVQDMTTYPYKEDNVPINSANEWTKRLLRHEMVHAFMYESGLDITCTFAQDETLIDFIALQLPKMSKAMNEIELLER